MDPSLQPEQEAARIETKKALDEFLETGKLKETEPLYAEGGDHGMLFFASKRYGTKLRKMAGPKPRLGSLLKAHLDHLKPGDYFAILAYLPATEQTGQAIQFFRHQLRGAKRVATTVGFGTALQHSTGQLFKGGPNTGVFLQITADQHSRDLIPGMKFSPGTVREAQSASDFDLLEQQGRRIARVHLGTDSKAGLRRLSEIIESALKDS
jgi:transaldolase/glucose-6-phosphate isomerase